MSDCAVCHNSVWSNGLGGLYEYDEGGVDFGGVEEDLPTTGSTLRQANSRQSSWPRGGCCGRIPMWGLKMGKVFEWDIYLNKFLTLFQQLNIIKYLINF